MSIPKIERIASTILTNTLPSVFPSASLVEFNYDLIKPLDGDGIIIELTINIYNSQSEKIDNSFSIATTYLFTIPTSQSEKKYRIFYQCLSNEISEFKKTLIKLVLNGYFTVDKIVNLPLFETVLPGFKR